MLPPFPGIGGKRRRPKHAIAVLKIYRYWCASLWVSGLCRRVSFLPKTQQNRAARFNHIEFLCGCLCIQHRPNRMVALLGPERLGYRRNLEHRRNKKV